MEPGRKRQTRLRTCSANQALTSGFPLESRPSAGLSFSPVSRFPPAGACEGQLPLPASCLRAGAVAAVRLGDSASPVGAGAGGQSGSR